MREPIVAGQFYEADKEKLKEQIQFCFKSKLGPGEIKNKTNKRIFGVTCPHAGYPFSGYGMAYSYKAIAESKLPELFVILGTNHNGTGETSAMIDDWKTPLGIVKTDKDFIKKLGISTDSFSHENEHSIEVQLPFLQYINKDIKVAGISISDYDKELAEKIAKTNKNICIIASGDFTHYGSSYGYVPFEDNIKENLYKLDKGAIKFIEKLDSKGFLDYIDKTGATICGRASISTAIECVKLLGAKRGKLLKYYTSGDTISDYNTAVGYASIIFE